MISLIIIMFKKQRQKEVPENIYWIFLVESGIESWIFVFVVAYYLSLLGQQITKIIF